MEHEPIEELQIVIPEPEPEFLEEIPEEVIIDWIEQWLSPGSQP